jgi:hypothetical protein
MVGENRRRQKHQEIFIYPQSLNFLKFIRMLINWYHTLIKHLNLQFFSLNIDWNLNITKTL